MVGSSSDLTAPLPMGPIHRGPIQGPPMATLTDPVLGGVTAKLANTLTTF